MFISLGQRLGSFTLGLGSRIVRGVRLLYLMVLYIYLSLIHMSVYVVSLHLMLPQPVHLL